MAGKLHGGSGGQMADDRIAIQHVDLVLAQAFQGGPLIVRKIDCAGNVALGVILGGPHVYDIYLVGLPIRSNSTGPVVKAILASKNSFAFAGS
jgi:hypothetical protein